MSRFKIVLFAAACTACSAAFAQPSNEGPRSVPRAENPKDAEHVPTRSDAPDGTAADSGARGERAEPRDPRDRLKDAKVRDAKREMEEAKPNADRERPASDTRKDEYESAAPRR